MDGLYWATSLYIFMAARNRAQTTALWLAPPGVTIEISKWLRTAAPRRRFAPRSAGRASCRRSPPHPAHSPRLQPRVFWDYKTSLRVAISRFVCKFAPTPVPDLAISKFLSLCPPPLPVPSNFPLHTHRALPAPRDASGQAHLRFSLRRPSTSRPNTQGPLLFSINVPQVKYAFSSQVRA